MESDDLSFWFFSILLLGTIGLSYYIGVAFTRKEWEAKFKLQNEEYAAVMDRLPGTYELICQQCSGQINP